MPCPRMPPRPRRKPRGDAGAQYRPAGPPEARCGMSAGSPVEVLCKRLDNVRPNGAGFTARCPAHEDRENSLSINEGDDGRALVKCFTGCDVERIVGTLGLTMRDLFQPRTSDKRATPR